MVGRHVTERRLAAIAAGEPETAHVLACARCQARLAEVRAWLDGTAADAAAMADAVFTPDRLAAQKQQVLARLEAAGRSARVIAFPVGTPAPAAGATMQIVRWASAAAAAGLLIGLASGRLLDPHTSAPPPVAVVQNPTTPDTVGVPASEAPREDLDEAALLEAAYDRVAIDALRTIEDMTPRAREVVLATGPGSRR
jgi:hypothetical protein